MTSSNDTLIDKCSELIISATTNHNFYSSLKRRALDLTSDYLIVYVRYEYNNVALINFSIYFMTYTYNYLDFMKSDLQF